MKTVLEVSTLMVRQVSTYTYTSYTRAMAVVGASLQMAPFVSFYLVLVSFTWHCSEQYMALYHSDIYIYIYIYIYMCVLENDTHFLTIDLQFVCTCILYVDCLTHMLDISATLKRYL
jgi:hypothetical protein